MSAEKVYFGGRSVSDDFERFERYYWWRVAAVFVVAIGLGVASLAAYGQVSVSVFGLSRHSQPGYCEVNPGLALNYHLSRDVRLLAGAYKNSKCHQSDVAGVVYCATRFGDVCLGSGFVRLTGYGPKAMYVPLPTASYERPGYAIDFVGGAYEGKAVIAVGLRFPL